MHRHLGGCMQSHSGCRLPDKSGKTDILHDNGVHTCLTSKAQSVKAISHFAVTDKGVEGKINLNTAHVTILNRFYKVSVTKVGGILARVKLACSQIDGVGTASDGGNQSVKGACRG